MTKNRNFIYNNLFFPCKEIILNIERKLLILSKRNFLLKRGANNFFPFLYNTDVYLFTKLIFFIFFFLNFDIYLFTKNQKEKNFFYTVIYLFTFNKQKNHVFSFYIAFLVTFTTKN